MRKIIRALIPYDIRVKFYKLRSINYYQFIKVIFFNKSDLYFEYNKEKYKYYIALYNSTFANERTIEIPIILGYIRKFTKKDILEIGNVISHYEKVDYDIVDKYEKKRNIINSDIIKYKPEKKYDLIVSISTFEHIGYDEFSYTENKDITVHQTSLIDALKNTKSLLKDNGVFIFTVPIGYNNFLDSQLKDNKLELTEAYFLKRITSDNKWIQVEYKDIVNVKYNNPYLCANAVMIGIYKKTVSQPTE